MKIENINKRIKEMKSILKNKKLIALIICVAIALCCMWGFVRLPAKQVKAEGNIEQLCKKFTDSDILYGEEKKTIRDFAEAMSNSNDYRDMTEITKIVPEEILLSSQKVFQYMGTEYGFIVMHDGGFMPCANVIIIDFDWVSRDKDNVEIEKPKEIMARAKVIVNAFFQKSNLSSKNIWSTEGNVALASNIYRLANMRYSAVLENADELNAEDYGYTMKDDNGLIIQNARVNFAGNTNKKVSLDWRNVLSIATKNVLGYIPLPGIAGIAFDALKEVGSIVDTALNVEREILKTGSNTETIIREENKPFIITKPSKSEQFQSGEFSQYTRTMYFNMQGIKDNGEEKEIFLPCGGYFEFILTMNETNQRSRLTRFLTFDLVKFDEVGNYEYFRNDDGEQVTCCAADRRILYDEPQTIDPEVRNFIYILPNESSKKQFTVTRNGNYEFRLSTQQDFDLLLTNKTTGEVRILSKNDKTYPARLTEGHIYVLEITGHYSKEFIYLNIDFSPSAVELGNNGIQFYNTKTEYVKIPAGRACHYKVSVPSGNVELNVFGDTTIVGNQSAGVVKFDAKSGKEYIISVTFSSPKSGEIRLNLSSERTVILIDGTSTRNYTIRNNEIFTLPAAASKTDFRCEGWYTQPSGQGQRITDDNFNDIDAVSVTLYAYYTILPDSQLTRYTITYRTNGGTAIPNGQYTIALTVTFPTPQYMYHGFKGWFRDADMRREPVTDTQGMTGNITLYAKWEQITCRLKFIDNTATHNTFADKVVDMGSAVSLPSLARTHYIGMWVSNGTTYASGSVINPVLSDMTLSVRWTPINYTIVYNNMYDKYLNQTAYTSAPKTYTYGTFINFAEYDARFSIAYPASQARCEFKGFYMDKNFKNAATLSSITSGEFHVYAKWIRLVSNTSRTNTTITDKGIDKNPTNTLTIGLDVYGSYMVQEQKAMGFNLVVIKIELTYHRIDDGYQHVYLYNGSAQLNHWEYSASNTTTRTEYMEVVMNIDDLNNVGALYIKYDASGAWSDDWYIERMSASVQFVHKAEDARSMKNGTIFY